MLRFPIVAAEESNEICFEQVSFFMMIEMVEDELHHIFVDNEARKDVIGSDPFIEGNKEKFLVPCGDAVKGIIE